MPDQKTNLTTPAAGTIKQIPPSFPKNNCGNGGIGRTHLGRDGGGFGSWGGLAGQPASQRAVAVAAAVNQRPGWRYHQPFGEAKARYRRTRHSGSGSSSRCCHPKDLNKPDAKSNRLARLPPPSSLAGSAQWPGGVVTPSIAVTPLRLLYPSPMPSAPRLPWRLVAFPLIVAFVAPPARRVHVLSGAAVAPPPRLAPSRSVASNDGSGVVSSTATTGTELITFSPGGDGWD
ncbi:hypothetical protein PR202_ga14743 [Eleusine coracana subsp. coracana]|uniref:Uncharacterized protein n=1 Tax=Eleusine coracana subsp. coracana TaxID=191504 RepID=A0AAV5CI65_ELECO|nr:hypothetical protein PR202_ga14743 [Eleusine coracana subsp. coracana]